MFQLYHFPLDPMSRAVRLALAEYELDFELVEERVWERRHEFLALNPAGSVPVLIDEDQEGLLTICGSSVIAEYIRERYRTELEGKLLFPDNVEERAEMRRLVEWFDRKFQDEVTFNIVHQKVDRQFMAKDAGGGPPDMTVVHAGLHNLRYHLKYIEYLMGARNWLTGEDLTHADLAAAAHLSVVDYLGHVPWEEFPEAKTWYARLKSRRSFRALLSDQVARVIPAAHYTDLDF